MWQRKKDIFLSVVVIWFLSSFVTLSVHGQDLSNIQEHWKKAEVILQQLKSQNKELLSQLNDSKNKTAILQNNLLLLQNETQNLKKELLILQEELTKAYTSAKISEKELMTQLEELTKVTTSLNNLQKNLNSLEIIIQKQNKKINFYRITTISELIGIVILSIILVL